MFSNWSAPGGCDFCDPRQLSVLGEGWMWVAAVCSRLWNQFHSFKVPKQWLLHRSGGPCLERLGQLDSYFGRVEGLFMSYNRPTHLPRRYKGNLADRLIAPANSSTESSRDLQFALRYSTTLIWFSGRFLRSRFLLWRPHLAWMCSADGIAQSYSL